MVPQPQRMTSLEARSVNKNRWCSMRTLTGHHNRAFGTHSSHAIGHFFFIFHLYGNSRHEQNTWNWFPGSPSLPLRISFSIVMGMPVKYCGASGHEADLSCHVRIICIRRWSPAARACTVTSPSDSGIQRRFTPSVTTRSGDRWLPQTRDEEHVNKSWCVRNLLACNESSTRARALTRESFTFIDVYKSLQLEHDPN